LIGVDTFLIPCIAVADGYGVVFQRFVIDGDTERRSDLALAGERFADTASQCSLIQAFGTFACPFIVCKMRTNNVSSL
jgi:hypothetical protein